MSPLNIDLRRQDATVDLYAAFDLCLAVVAARRGTPLTPSSPPSTGVPPVISNKFLDRFWNRFDINPDPGLGILKIIPGSSYFPVNSLSPCWLGVRLLPACLMSTTSCDIANFLNESAINLNYKLAGRPLPSPFRPPLCFANRRELLLHDQQQRPFNGRGGVQALYVVHSVYWDGPGAFRGPAEQWVPCGTSPADLH